MKDIICKSSFYYATESYNMQMDVRSNMQIKVLIFKRTLKYANECSTMKMPVIIMQSRVII